MTHVIKLKPYPLYDIMYAKSVDIDKNRYGGYTVHMVFKNGEYIDKYAVEFDNKEDAKKYIDRSHEITKQRNAEISLREKWKEIEANG